MRMMAYLGGDTNTLACRRAKTSDIRLAVEYPDHDRMIVLTVMQSGEIMMAWTKVRGSEAVDYMEVVGKVVENDNQLVFITGNEEPTFRPPTTQPVRFDNSILRVVPDPEDDEDEVF